MAKLKSIFVIMVTLTLPGCPRQDAPPAPKETSLSAIVVKPRAGLLYTYFSGAGFETTNKLEDVPEANRGWVRIVDTKVKPNRRRDHELVYVADLRKAKGDGSYTCVVLSRKAFELAAKNHPGGASDPPSSQPAAATTASVILYSTQWCSACKAARQFLKSKGIRFVEKDIERDEQAAAELMQKARAAGISTSGVPVLDVGGKLMQGFDAQRLMSLLGKSGVNSKKNK